MSNIFTSIEKEVDLIGINISALDSFTRSDGEMNMDAARHLVRLIQTDIKQRQTNLLRATSQLKDNHAEEQRAKKENRIINNRISKALDMLEGASGMTLSASIESKDEATTKYFSGAAVRISAAKRVLTGGEA